MQEAPRRLPPAGASSFWDRDHPSAPATRETPQSVATATTEVQVLGASRPHAATVIWLHGDHMAMRVITPHRAAGCGLLPS